jgi:cytochrome P450
MRDEVMTLFFAGHETTASALAWSWWLISEHPEVEARVHDEVDRVLAGRVPNWDDLPQLQYTKQVLQESMRVRPPVPVYARVSVEEDEIAGYRIPPDTMVMISPYVTHRLPEFWPDPERFDPDRFALGRIQERPRFAYVPFAAGPRLCMGRNFALMEGTFVIAMVAQRYRLKLVPGHPIEMKTMATMRPRHGVRMTLHAR